MRGKVFAIVLFLAASPAVAQDDDWSDPEQWTILAPGGIGSPVGYMGFQLGYEFAPPFALEAGVGLGSTGIQIPVLARYYLDTLDRPHRLSVATGPSVGLLSESLGLNVPHDDSVSVDRSDLFYVGYWNVELTWEVRARFGLMFRAGLGAFVRLFEHMSHLCNGSDDLDCQGLHIPTGPQAARVVVAPYLTYGLGWAF